jgi:hypothetical protein
METRTGNSAIIVAALCIAIGVTIVYLLAD